MKMLSNSEAEFKKVLLRKVNVYQFENHLRGILF